MKKLFKFMYRTIYSTVILTFVIMYVSIKINNSTYPGELGQAYIYFVFPVLLVFAFTGFIGLFVLRIKEAHAERKSGVKQIQTQDKEE